MHTCQAVYRALRDRIGSYSERGLYRDVLLPWVDANGDERDWLRSFAERRGGPIPPAAVEDLWRLYALGVVNETLLLRFQPLGAGGEWEGPDLSLTEYESFFTALGLELGPAGEFSPFYHEIVRVEQSANDDDPITLLDVSWPGLMLEPMMFSRAGVIVSGGRHHVLKSAAEASTMYWAYWRRYRPYHDLSHGWGSNSSWRTRFRRDYRIRDTLYFNVDGENDLAAPASGEGDRDGLTSEERIELLTNRCFIRTEKPHDDLWPYDDVYRMPYSR